MSDDDTVRGITKYEQIERMIRERIQRGELKPGEKLESETSIAERLGVHRFTVNKALSSLVRQGLLSRVQGRGTFVAGQGARAAAGCLGVLYSSGTKGLSDDWFYGSILRGLSEESGGALMLLGDSGRQGLPGPPIERIAWERLDGLVLLEVFDDGYIEQVRRAAPIPVVVIDYQSPALRCDHVVLDDRGGSRAAVSHLLGLGHRRIAHFGEPPPPQKRFVDPAWQLRREGWEDALREAGVRDAAPLFFPLKGRSSQGAGELLREILARPAALRPTAYFCATDDLAMALMRQAQESGVRVPAEVSFIGYGGTAASALARPALTTVIADVAEMGRWAVRRIGDLRAGRELDPQRKVLPTELLVRESCARAP